MGILIRAQVATPENRTLRATLGLHLLVQPICSRFRTTFHPPIWIFRSSLKPHQQCCAAASPRSLLGAWPRARSCRQRPRTSALSALRSPPPRDNCKMRTAGVDRAAGSTTAVARGLCRAARGSSAGTTGLVSLHRRSTADRSCLSLASLPVASLPHGPQALPNLARTSASHRCRLRLASSR